VAAAVVAATASSLVTKATHPPPPATNHSADSLVGSSGAAQTARADRLDEYYSYHNRFASHSETVDNCFTQDMEGASHRPTVVSSTPVKHKMNSIGGDLEWKALTLSSSNAEDCEPTSVTTGVDLTDADAVSSVATNHNLTQQQSSGSSTIGTSAADYTSTTNYCSDDVSHFGRGEVFHSSIDEMSSAVDTQDVHREELEYVQESSAAAAEESSTTIEFVSPAIHQLVVKDVKLVNSKLVEDSLHTPV